MAEKIYVFKVTMRPHNIYRIIEVKGATNLNDFAEVITNSFNFDFSHAFGFHSNIGDFYNSSESYTYFRDHCRTIDPHEKSVINNYVHNVFQPNKKMLFHYDYGDDWKFLVECSGVKEPQADRKYPFLAKEKGDAPLQYGVELEDD